MYREEKLKLCFKIIYGYFNIRNIDERNAFETGHFKYATIFLHCAVTLKNKSNKRMISKLCYSGQERMPRSVEKWRKELKSFVIKPYIIVKFATFQRKSLICIGISEALRQTL